MNIKRNWVNKMIWRRLGSYIIDFVLVLLIVAVVGMFFPKDDSLDKQLEEQVYGIFSGKEISDDETEGFFLRL